MIRHMAMSVVLSMLSFNLYAMASDSLSKGVSTLYQLSKQAIINQEPDIRFEKLAVCCIPRGREYEWLRNAALCNMLRRDGLGANVERMENLVAGKSRRFDYQKSGKILRLPKGAQELAGRNEALQSPIDLIDPGNQMTSGHRTFMRALRKQGFTFNSPAGLQLVFRAVKNNNLDFVRYALQHGFDVRLYQQEVEKSLSYTFFQDYSEDMLLPFLSMQPSQQSCKDFLPVIRLLIKKGAQVKQLHIDQADNVQCQELKKIFVHYFKKQPITDLSSPWLAMEPVKNKKLVAMAGQVPVFNPAALDYLKQQSSPGDQN